MTWFFQNINWFSIFIAYCTGFFALSFVNLFQNESSFMASQFVVHSSLFMTSLILFFMSKHKKKYFMFLSFLQLVFQVLIINQTELVLLPVLISVVGISVMSFLDDYFQSRSRLSKFVSYFWVSIIIGLGLCSLFATLLQIDLTGSRLNYLLLDTSIASGLVLLGLTGLNYYKKKFESDDPKKLYECSLITIISLCVTLLISTVLETRNEQFIRQIIRSDLEAQANNLSNVIKNNRKELQQLANRLAINGYLSTYADLDLEEIYRNHKEISTLIYLDKYNVKQNLIPETHEFDLDNLRIRPELLESYLSKSLVTTPVISLRETPSFAFFIPIYQNGEPLGTIIAVFKLNTVLLRALDPIFLRDYELLIHDGSEQLFTFKSQSSATVSVYSSNKKSRYMDLQFLLTSIPNQTFMGVYHTYLPEILFLLGILISGLMGVFVYLINSLKYAHNQLDKQRKRLEASNKSLMDFAYVASHDLKEPLRSISGFCTIIHQRYKHIFDEESEYYFKFITQGCVRLQNLLNDLLMYSRVSNQSNLTEKVNLNEVLQLVKQNLQDVVQSYKAEITSCHLPTITASKTGMIQLFQNIITNAIKYSKEGISPKIRIHYKDLGDEVTLTFEDNGIGMDKKLASGELFEMFKRGHSKDDYSGTGIGLAICKKIVELHNGTIWVQSTLGEGSIFYVNLPIKRVVS